MFHVGTGFRALVEAGSSSNGNLTLNGLQVTARHVSEASRLLHPFLPPHPHEGLSALQRTKQAVCWGKRGWWLTCVGGVAGFAISTPEVDGAFPQIFHFSIS